MLCELCLGCAPLELKKLPGVTLVGVLEASSLSEMHNGLHEPDLDGPDEYPDELKTSFVYHKIFGRDKNSLLLTLGSTRRLF